MVTLALDIPPAAYHQPTSVLAWNWKLITVLLFEETDCML
jgi:hypothetical protein